MNSVIAPLLTGIAFGFSLDRAIVTVPVVIRDQFDFSNFTMLRMFLSAAAVSSLAVTLMHLTDIKKRKPNPEISLNAAAAPFSGNVLGGLLLGSGMALSGSCPGTVFPQLGARPDISRLAVAGGCLFGTLLYAYAVNKTKHLKPVTSARGTDTPLTTNAASLVVAAVCAAAVVAVQGIFPWQQQALRYLPTYSSAQYIWDPAICGAMVGALQLLTSSVLGAGLGASSGWVYFTSILATPFDPDMKKNSPYLVSAKCEQKAQWQAVQAVGAVVGGYLSQHVLFDAKMMGSRLLATAGGVDEMSLTANFVGGVLLLLGARLGGGCTSGQGLTGMANMGMSSMITVVSMFAGGIATTVLFTRA